MKKSMSITTYEAILLNMIPISACLTIVPNMNIYVDTSFILRNKVPDNHNNNYNKVFIVYCKLKIF